MDQKIFFIGDVEMGRGDIMDDFTDDYMLIDFIEKLGKLAKKSKVKLVMLGDIFDFLKMPYKSQYPRHITEDISLWKMNEIINNHGEIFRALKIFLENPNSSLHIIIGNHDADLAWEKVRLRLKETLRTNKQLEIGYHFSNKDIHAEHGHLLDPLFAIDIKKPAINYKGHKILNLPWGAYACFTHLIKLKREFPRESCLYPNPMVLEMNDKFRNKAHQMARNLILKSLIIHPITRFFDPTYRPPYIKMLKHTLRFGLNVTDDEKFINHRVNKSIKSHPDKKILIFGHAHVLTDMEQKGRKIFITDTWRDEYDLTRGEKKKPKSYVEINYRDNRLISARMKII